MCMAPPWNSKLQHWVIITRGLQVLIPKVMLPRILFRTCKIKIDTTGTFKIMQ